MAGQSAVMIALLGRRAYISLAAAIRDDAYYITAVTNIT
jgi:hypothetical protein